MHIIIIGAGEVGKFLAETLSSDRNNVVVVDCDEAVLLDLQEHMDVLVINGNGAMISTLQQAGIEKADILLAVSNNPEANILACQMASHFKVGKTICRTNSRDFFSKDDDQFSPKEFGIDQLLVPAEECASKIMHTVKNPELKEIVSLSHPDAKVVSFLIRPESALVGAKLDKFPRPELLEKLRICAIFRRGRLIFPRGNTRLNVYDEIYVAGHDQEIEELLELANAEQIQVKSVIISGATPLSMRMIELLNEEGIDVKLIESDAGRAEEAMKELKGRNIVINGDATSVRILEEAGIDNCDVFLSTVNDETSILTCLLAKRNGATKVFAVANKPGYLEIVAGIGVISAAFSLRMAAINGVLHHVRADHLKVAALLKRIPAEVLEFEIGPKSKMAGKSIDSINWPSEAVVAMIIRDGTIIPATGSLVIMSGDSVSVMAEKHTVATLEKLFSKKNLF